MAPRPRAPRLAPALILWPLVAVTAAGDGPSGGAIRFNRDIRPILADRCFACHGPDAGRRKADLRLDAEDGARRDLGGRFAVVPGRPDDSELVFRVESDDPDLRMPPPSTGKPLDPGQVALLRRWIESGAAYEGHWAFSPPGRPEPPAVRDADWCRNPVDRFVLARLEAEGLAPSPEADRATLIRRLSLDLTGLPPTTEEVEAYLRDESPEAYGRLVDRLLASPAYGERMALLWLDLARYADTSGYQIDNVRTMWPWRDWVIDASNRNMPFDRFTVEQVAGDLLPDATLAQRIATGFNRNHRISNEGGIIEEELRVEYVVDRANTTATVWLGLTMGCAQCHDHKYDPITQRDYYRFFAYFNSVADRGNDGANGNAAPLVKVPTPEQSARLGELDREVAEAEATLAAALPAIDAGQAAWESSARAGAAWAVLGGVTPARSLGGATLTRLEDGSFLATGPAPDTDTYEVVALTEAAGLSAIRLEALRHESLPNRGAGRAPNANFVLTGFEVTAAPAFEPKAEAPVKLRAALADYSQAGFDIAAAIDADPRSGWAVDGPTRREDRVAVFVPEAPVGAPGGTLLRIRLKHDHGGRHAVGRFRLSVATDPAAASAPLPAEVAAALAVEPAKRTPEQAAKVRDHHRSAASPEWAALDGQVKAVRARRDAFDATIPTTMVMEDLPQPRRAHVLKRGQYDQPSEPVEPGVPAALPPLPPDAPPNRLALARWLVDPGHPLTARVMVNRLWEMHFGAGLVRTGVDFGSQGEWPTHPELLDWLATEFVATGWDVKAMHRLIVTSAAYRQSSRVTPALIERDPDNRLLARGTRFRLPAEVIRDNALAVSGLLVGKVGGPPVRPYQPAGLWEEVSYPGTSSYAYRQDGGESLYRRSLYTFWKRTVPPASLATFDAPSREVCTASRPRTNTPLQALVLLNDPTYVEAARALAERAIKADSSLEGRVAWMFRRVTCRPPRAVELEVLAGGLRRRLEAFRADRAAAEAAVAVGESPRDPAVDVAELAAYATVAGVILNLDETVTRE